MTTTLDSLIRAHRDSKQAEHDLLMAYEAQRGVTDVCWRNLKSGLLEVPPGEYRECDGRCYRLDGNMLESHTCLPASGTVVDTNNDGIDAKATRVPPVADAASWVASQLSETDIDDPTILAAVPDLRISPVDDGCGSWPTPTSPEEAEFGLRVAPEDGRRLVPADDVPDAHPGALQSHPWKWDGAASPKEEPAPAPSATLSFGAAPSRMCACPTCDEMRREDIGSAERMGEMP